MKTAAGVFDLLELKTQPVAVAFLEEPPEGLPRIEEAALSGCTYWKLASRGRSFYTEARDHHGCPIGSYTHGIDLPANIAEELDDLIKTMVQLEYLDMEEVPGIPRRQESVGIVAYAPLAGAPFQPDVVLVAGNPRQMMLLAEAARAAGLSSDAAMGGRPTCAAIPAVMQSGQTATNLGCIGNRVYTELADDELYFAVAGPQLEAVAEKLSTIVNANRELEKFHRGRFS